VLRASSHPDIARSAYPRLSGAPVLAAAQVTAMAAEIRPAVRKNARLAIHTSIANWPLPRSKTPHLRGLEIVEIRQERG